MISCVRSAEHPQVLGLEGRRIVALRCPLHILDALGSLFGLKILPFFEREGSPCLGTLRLKFRFVYAKLRRCLILTWPR